MRWVALFGVVGACGGAEEPLVGEERVEAVLELDGHADAGSDVYDARCAQCHGGDGSGMDGELDLGGVDLRGVDREGVVRAVVTPGEGMLSFATLPDQDIADVAVFASAL